MLPDVEDSSGALMSESGANGGCRFTAKKKKKNKQIEIYSINPRHAHFSLVQNSIYESQCAHTKIGPKKRERELIIQCC